MLKYPSQVSGELFQWTQSYHYGQYYSEYPNLWSMVSEPILDNYYYPPYLVTSNFTKYCPSGGSAYNSSADSSDIQTISCTDNSGNKNIIAINTLNSNYTLNINGDTQINVSAYGIAYIPYIDPISINFVSPTPNNGITLNAKSAIINVPSQIMGQLPEDYKKSMYYEPLKSENKNVSSNLKSEI